MKCSITLSMLALIFMLSGCETIQYGNDVAYEGYSKHHTPRSVYSAQKSTGTCVDHTIWTAGRLGTGYEVVLLQIQPDLWHSVLKAGDNTYDINFGETYSYSGNYAGRYMAEKNLGFIPAQDIAGVLSVYTLK